MDIALPTLVLLFLLIPGFLFRRFYYSEEFSKEYFTEKVSENILSTAVLSLIIHVSGYFLFVRLIYRICFSGSKSIHSKFISLIVSGEAKSNTLYDIIDNIKSNFTEITAYGICMLILSAYLGKVCKSIVRRFKLDRKFKLFRFQNEWHYFFSGEMLDFPRVAGSHEDVDFSYLDVLVDTSAGLILYTGILSDYSLSKDGGIDRVCLSEAKRRYIKDDADPKYYDMPGKFFVIPFSEVKNIHITYYSIVVNPSTFPNLNISGSVPSRGVSLKDWKQHLQKVTGHCNNWWLMIIIGIIIGLILRSVF